jgi:uncharacterized membrane protein YebE (DUF533 family)
MFDAKRLLFGLLRSQMTGSRSHRVQRGFGGSTLGGIGGGLLGSLAMTALQSYMERQRSPASPAATTPSPESATIEEDEVAQILVQVMIAAARADGEIIAAERQRILDELTQAGADEEERLFLQRELDKPLDLDAVLRRIRDHQMEEEAYTASLLAIEVDTLAEQQYLAYLATRLNLESETVVQLHERFDAPRPLST